MRRVDSSSIIQREIAPRSYSNRVLLLSRAVPVEVGRSANLGRCFSYIDYHASSTCRVIRVAITTRSKNSRTVDRQSIDPGMTIRWRLVHKSPQLLSLECCSIFVQYSSSDKSLEAGTLMLRLRSSITETPK